MKIYYNIPIAAAMTCLMACSSDNFTPQQGDEYSKISFSAKTINLPVAQTSTRAGESPTHSHTPYSPENRPTTMGVFGYGSMNEIEIWGTPGANGIFNNQQVTYDSEQSKWDYTSPKYWADYATLTPFDFFGYMPYSASNVTLTRPSKNGDSETYTLSFPASITDLGTGGGLTSSAGSPYPITVHETALVCHEPYATENVGGKVTFQMDQTLTGFYLQFQLGDRMDDVRDVTIKSVKIKGTPDKFATGGTVSRTYTRTYTDYTTTWTAGDVTWSALVQPAADVEVTVNHTADLLLSTEFQKWGGTFYAIPSSSFTPTIEVTYDVTLNGPGELTRKTVISSIELNNTNFSNYTPGNTKPGYIYPVKIKIVPSYLYVMADGDQTVGTIVINEE